MNGLKTFETLCIVMLLLFMSTLGLVGCGKLEDERPSSPFAPPKLYDTPPPARAPETSPEPVPAVPEQSFGNILLSESLRNGHTTGVISDGTLTPEGVQLIGGDGSIKYSIPTTPRGYVEFNAQGFIPNELHGGSEFKAVLFTMWSGLDGYSYENAPFVFELRKYGFIEGRPDASDAFFFKIKSNGVWEEGHFHVLSWHSGFTYRIRIEWSGGQARAFRDGQLVATGPYYGEFAPSDHQVQIGAQPLRQKKSPHGLLISDVIIGVL